MSSTNSHPLEKDFSPSSDGPNGTNTSNNNNQRGDSHFPTTTNTDNEVTLQKIRTAGSISLSPELFEKLYLSPQNAVRGDLRKTFGNPTPLCLIGFLMSLHPLSCDLMGWRGAGGGGAASIGAYFFFGGLLMTIGGVLEFILGNTFPFVVFGSFGGFWLTYGAILQPFFNSYGAYADSGSPAAEGLTTTGFNSSLAFFFLFMGLLCLIYLICALRTNVVFVVIFFTLFFGFAVLSGSYWQGAQGNTVQSSRLLVAAGAFFFVTCLAGWWIFFSIMLASLDFPFQIPVGDLSTIIKARSIRQREKDGNIV